MLKTIFTRYFTEKDVKIEVERILASSERAVKVLYCGQVIWLPKSQVSIKQADGKIIITMPAWLHRKKVF